MEVLSVLIVGSSARSALLLFAGLVLAQVAHYLIVLIVGRLASRRRSPPKSEVVRYVSAPIRLLLTFAAIAFCCSVFPLAISPKILSLTYHAFEVASIATFTWFAIGVIEVLHLFVLGRLPEEIQNNVAARRVRTQVNFFRQVAIGLAFFFGTTTILITFPVIRSLGAGLFASAGVAGLVLGIAGRPTLGNLIAGIQIAITEAIRIDDAVVVEGDFGRIVEINTTNVVIRLWDLRHLIVPISHFVEKPFQNWTRYSSDLIGAVHLQLDYMVRVEQLRKIYQDILEASELWDRRTMLVQVTDATGSAVELRFLMSAATPADTFTLRCHVREALIAYLQDSYPQALPRSRSDVAMTGTLKCQDGSDNRSDV